MNTIGLVYYYTFGKWYLDEALFIAYWQDLEQHARVGKRWLRKVRLLHKVSLGNNIRSFSSRQEAIDYALKYYPKLPAVQYEAFIETDTYKWFDLDKKL